MKIYVLDNQELKEIDDNYTLIYSNANDIIHNLATLINTENVDYVFQKSTEIRKALNEIQNLMEKNSKEVAEYDEITGRNYPTME